VKIHALQTGTVRVKPSQRVGRGRGSIRQLNILLDRSWTELLPIYAWAIETVDGVIIVDTGETARTREPGYFPRWHPYFRLAVRLDVTPEQIHLRSRNTRDKDLKKHDYLDHQANSLRVVDLGFKNTSSVIMMIEVRATSRSS
jgi:hypothetical protein